MHFEAYISASPARKEDLQQHLGFLQVCGAYD